MAIPDIDKIIRQKLKELERIRDRVLPVKVGRAVRDSVRENFRQGGFYGSKWQDTKRRELGFSGVDGQYGPLLSRQNHLRSSTDYVPGKGSVTIQNTTEYAEIHNEGGDIPVTVRMKKFFWAKAYAEKDKESPEAGFWKAMALKKPGSVIKIPKRQFMGPHPEVEKMIEDITNKELQNHINNGINNRRTR